MTEGTKMRSQLLTTGEIAKYCQVSQRAVYQWISAGKMKSYKTPGSHSRVNREDFLSFLRSYHMAIPQEFHAQPPEEKWLRVLIVEDDCGIVKVIQNTLASSERFLTKVAYDGFNAGLLFSQFRPDIVTLDLRMPMVDGFEVCAQIRQDPANQDVKILIISDVDDPQEQKRILQMGADDLLVKPISSAELMKRIERLAAVY